MTKDAKIKIREISEIIASYILLMLFVGASLAYIALLTSLLILVKSWGLSIIVGVMAVATVCGWILSYDFEL